MEFHIPKCAHCGSEDHSSLNCPYAGGPITPGGKPGKEEKEEKEGDKKGDGKKDDKPGKK